MIAFLIDADNFSAPAWIDEAFQTLERTEGPIAIRRAYGNAENLKGLADTLRVWAIRPFVNLPLPKNTTDMSLALDAMELACVAPRPRLVVIGSGDLDFVPLVVRLRERGIKVVCISERSKLAQDAVRAYDQIIYVGTEHLTHPVAQEAEAAPSKAVSGRAARKEPAARTPALKATAPKLLAKKVAKKSTGMTPEAITASKILKAVPSLKSGQWQPLGDVAKVLHDERLLAKSATSTKLFKKFPHHFELTPQGKPNQVRFVLPPL
jgi:NYN domain